MLPNLIVIGSRKSATTSLHYYLGLHPEIFMSRAYKELNFFVKEMRWKKGIRWYEEQFPVAAAIRGESSPNYSRFPAWKGVPERMHALIPRAKLIYMVRDPVERLLSAYHHDHKGGVEARTFDEMMKSNWDENPYVSDSRYHLQLMQFLKYYPESQIRVVSSEDLSQDPFGVMDETFKFLGVDSAFRSSEFFKKINVLAETVRRKQCKLERFADMCERKSQWLGQVADSLVPIYFRLKKKKPMEPRWDARPPVVSVEVRQRLREYFRTDIEKLSRLTGQSFEHYLVEVVSPSHSKISKQAQQWGQAFNWQKEKG